MLKEMGGIVAFAALMAAQTSVAVRASGPILSFTATTSSVAGAPDSIRIDLLRWSTDAERDRLTSAWNMAGAGRGGRGSGEVPQQTPEGALAAALKQATTVGYLWSSEVAGYALRYAGKVAGPDGVDRIILITDRRLGKTNDLWTLAEDGTPVTPPAPHDFSVVELRVNSKGEGEGTVSLTGKVTLDNSVKIVAPENYGALPVILKNLKRVAVEEH